jgi:hypothetical protein
MNCRRLRFASVSLAFARAPSVRSGLASLGLRYFGLPEKFSPVLFLPFNLLHLFFTVVFDIE